MFDIFQGLEALSAAHVQRLPLFQDLMTDPSYIIQTDFEVYSL